MRTLAQTGPPRVSEPAPEPDQRTIVSRVLDRLRRFLRGQKVGIRFSKSKGSLLLRADRLTLTKHHLLLKVLPECLEMQRGRSTQSVSTAPMLVHSVVDNGKETRVKLIIRTAYQAPSPSPESMGRAPEEALEAARRVLKAASRSKAVFVTRVLNAVARLGEEVPERNLAAASTAPTDYGVLVCALGDPAAVEELRRSDPLAPARLRGIEARQRLIDAEGGILSAAEVAKFLGISRQAVDKRRRLGRLLGLQRGRRGYAYPAWQFTRSGTLAGLEDVLEALRQRDPWMQLAFMLNANSRLGGSAPLDELRHGRTDAVREAALSYGEQSAD